MNNRGTVNFLSILTVFWFIGCSYIYLCHVCSYCYGNQVAVSAPAPTSFSSLLIRDGDFSVTAPAGPTFDISTDNANFDGQSTEAFKSVANYLSKNPNKGLSITGQYKQDETNNTTFGNLGIARAEAVKKNILGYVSGIDASRIKTNGRQSYNLRFINQKTDGGLTYLFSNQAPKPKPAPVAATGSNINISDGAFSATAPFGMFNMSDDALTSNPQLNNAFKKVANHLKSNPDKSLKITGQYKNDEQNNTWFDNLGIARAEAFKKAILSAGVNGISADQIETIGRLNNGLAFNNNKTNGNLSFLFGVVNKNASANKESQMTAIGKRLKAAPKNFYFDPGSSVISLDAEMRTYFKELKAYLNFYGNESVTLTGHTDADGNAGANKKLGQDRANLIRDYMVRNGLKANQIKTTSKGEEAPLADNNTPEGKAKNRRVEISL